MSDFNELMERCRAWLDHDTAFTNILKDAAVQDPTLAPLIVEHAQVDERIVARWISGDAVPHAQIQMKIIKTILIHLTTKL